nr:MAG TPA_asm: hypothetical protein [Caudoviricetes sp.]
MSRLTYIKDLVNGALNEAYNYRFKGGYQQRKPRQEVTGNKPIFCTNVYKRLISVNGQRFNKYIIKICGVEKSDIDYIDKNKIALLHKSNNYDTSTTSRNQKILQADVMPSRLYAHFLYASVIDPEAWLNNQEKGFPKLIEYLSKRKATNGEDLYDPLTFGECKQQIIRKYREALNDEEFIQYAYGDETVELNDMRISEFEAKIREALQNGNWEEAISTYRIDLKTRLFGNQLTQKNKNSIYSQARKRGLTEASPNWPTFVRSRKTWESLGFKVKDNAIPYFISSFVDIGQSPEVGFAKMGLSKHEIEQASQQMRDVAQMTGVGRGIPGPAYDISDVEDVSNGGRWMKEAGLANNLEGILNDAAIEFEKNKDKEQDSEFNKRRAEELRKIETKEGKAEVFNELLKDYVEINNDRHNLGITLKDSGQNYTQAYLNNLYNYAKEMIQNKGWDAEIDTYAYVFRSIVASQTIGTENTPRLTKEQVEIYRDAIGEAHRLLKFMARTVYKEFREYQDSLATQSQEVNGAQQAVNESVEEAFTPDNFNTFNDKMSKIINANADFNGINRDAVGRFSGRGVTYLYHATSSAGKTGITTNGASRLMTGSNSNFYGPGVYTNLDLGDAIGGTSIYGDYIVKFVLKGGFKDFLIFDKDFNQRHGTGESIKDQLKRIAPEILDYMQKNFDRRTYNYILHWSGDSMRAPGGVRGNDRGFRSAGQVRAFLGTPVSYRQKGDCYVPDSMLKASNIRGYIFRGSGDGRVVVVRNFTDVMPVAWTTAQDAEAYFNGDRKRNIWRQINQKSFEKLNQKHDAYEEYSAKYPKIDKRESNSAGFVRVPKGGKYNFIDPDTHEEIFPFDFDNATNFSPTSREATVEILGDEYTLYSNMDKVITVEKDEFDAPTMSLGEFIDLIQSQTQGGVEKQLSDQSKLVSEQFHNMLERMDNYQIL